MSVVLAVLLLSEESLFAVPPQALSASSTASPAAAVCALVRIFMVLPFEGVGRWGGRRSW